MFYSSLESPLGRIILTASSQGMTGIYLPEHIQYQKAQAGIRAPHRFEDVMLQLSEYFEGKRRKFTGTWGVGGTAFQQNVWRVLQDIPYGETRSYQEIAAKLDMPHASRAVGLANKKNPLAILIPCHRVIGANGALTGYAGGVSAKAWLLAHEKSISP